MILSLAIKDFVLIDEALSHFTKGLNVLTGETGSGKSAVIDALSQILGARGDVSLIRKGQEKAIIEALFDISELPAVSKLLENMGFSVDPLHLHIKREIREDGKGRIWINRETAPLNALKALSPHLIEFVSQRANRDLIDSENHVEIFDTIAGLIPLREQFKEAHLSQLKKERELKLFRENREEFLKKQERIREDLQEIESVSPKSGEEEALFEEYSLLANVDELKNALTSILNESSLEAISFVKKKLEEFLKVDASLQEALAMTIEAFANMKEVERSLDLKLSSLEENPERLIFLEGRLKAYARLKRLFGDDVMAKWEELKELQNFGGEDGEEQLTQEISALKETADHLAKNLSEKRAAASFDFNARVTRILHTLNMPSAEFTVNIQKKSRSEIGDDLIEFFLAPNLGENPVSVSDSASGGELSRVLLAIKLMEEKSHASIIFDEIDANIGGNTAVMVGEKLKLLSLRKQVILITHFPQVARFACHHIKISKKEREGRTYTEIEHLDETARESELLRMLGNSL